jgi:hypothetical protein
MKECTVKKTKLASIIGLLFPAIAGAQVSVAFNGAQPDQGSLVGAMNGINPVPVSTFNAVSTNTPATLTGNQIAGGEASYVNMTAALGGAGTLNTPTATAILQALPPAANVVGYTNVVRIINSSSGAFAWTVTAGSGVTLAGTLQTIAQNTWRDYVLTVTGVTTPAVTMQSVGTGTWS